MTELVIPDPDSLGIRVTRQTSLGVVVAALRRRNPTAPYAALKAVAEDMRRDPAKYAAAVEPAVATGGLIRAGQTFVVGEDGPPPFTVPPAEAKPDRAAVVQWAAGVGMDWSGKGRIPAQIVKAYRDAHREEALASMVPVEGGAPIPAEPPAKQL